MKYILPVNYEELHWTDRKAVREQYITEQEGKCLYCGCSLSEKPPEHILDKKINWGLFPRDFLKYPIHLQHDHETGMTEGAVHSYCNAVMWHFDGK